MKQLIARDVLAVQNSQNASHSLNGLGSSQDWIVLLREQQIKSEVAQELEKATSILKRGKDIDPMKLRSSIEKLTNNTAAMMRLSDVEDKPMLMIKTGWRSLDAHLGGLPEAGLVTILAPTKMGKTSVLIRIAGSMLKQYPEKDIAIFSIEMTETQFKARWREIWPECKNEDLRRLRIDHLVDSVYDVSAKAASLEVSMIGIDFADLLITGEVDPSKMEEIYRVLSKLATRLSVPIVLLAQTNDAWKGGVPRPSHIRWSRMAEALSFMLLAVYNPAKDYKAEDSKANMGLEHITGKAYVVCWLCRSKTEHDLPGAIQVPWNGQTGWADGSPGKWYELETGATKSKQSRKRVLAIGDDDDRDNNWSDYDDEI